MAVTARVIQWFPDTQTAEVEGFPHPVPFARHVEPSLPGDTVLVVSSRSGQAWLVACLGPTPTVARPVVQDTPAPWQPLPTQEPVTLRPKWSGTWRNGWRSDTSDLYQGDWTGRGINTGSCWWGTLPSQVASGSLRIVRNPLAGPGAPVTPTMTLLPGTSRPSSLPTPILTTAGPTLARGQAVDWEIPDDWIQHFRNGTAGGIGCTSNGSSAPYLGLMVSDAGMTLTLNTST